MRKARLSGGLFPSLYYHSSETISNTDQKKKDSPVACRLYEENLDLAGILDG